jgi:anti-anti-sigma factor
VAAYVVPQGWVENYTADNGHRAMVVFHLTDQCAGIRRADRLRPVPRPGSAARCRRCAAVDIDRDITPRTPVALAERPVHVSGDATRTPVLTLTGEHDITTRDQVQAACDSVHLRSGTERLTIDLRRTTFADCTTLGLLIGLAARARRSSVEVRTHVPDDGRLEHVLRLLGADLLLGVASSGRETRMTELRRGTAATRSRRAATQNA